MGDKYKAKMTAKSKSVFPEVFALLSALLLPQNVYRFTCSFPVLCIVILLYTCPLPTPCPGPTLLSLSWMTPWPFYTFEPLHWLLPLAWMPFSYTWWLLLPIWETKCHLCASSGDLTVWCYHDLFVYPFNPHKSLRKGQDPKVLRVFKKLVSE